MTDDILLSDREREAWELTRDISYDDAAEAMGITRNTLEKHLERCYAKKKKARATLEWFEEQEEE